MYDDFKEMVNLVLVQYSNVQIDTAKLFPALLLATKQIV